MRDTDRSGIKQKNDTDCLPVCEAERTLRESEERLRALSEAAFEGIGITRKGVILEANQALTNMTGYERSELIGTSLIDLILPEYRDIAASHILGGLEEPYEAVFRRKNGTTFVAEARGRAMIFKGQPARVGAIIDITKRKQIENALRESEEHYRALFNAIDEGFCIVEVLFDEGGKPVDYRLLEVNPAFERQTGIPNAQGRRMRELVPKLEDFWFETYGNIAVSGKPARFQSRSEELQRDFDVYAFRFGPPEKRQVAVLFSDITEQTRASEETIRSRDLLQAIIDNTPAAIYIKDLDGTIILANKALADVFGMSKEDVIGKTSYDFYPHEVADQHTENDREIMRGGKPDSFEEIVPKDGDIHTFLSIKFPLKDQEGNIRGIGGVSTEITERVRAEQALARALDEARRDRQRLEAMESIADIGISATELGDLLEASADRIAHALGTYSCTILLCENSEYLIARAAHGIPEACGFRVKTDQGFVGKILSTRRTTYVSNAETDPLVVDLHIKRAGVKSLLGTPLIARGNIAGVVYVNEIRVREFSKDERRLLENMASRVALIAENARLYEQLAKSRDEIQRNFTFLQRSLLPPGNLQVGPGYRMAASYLSPFGLEIGGDFYDVFDTETGRHALLIGDVAGKGVSAVSLATSTRSTIRALTYNIPSVGEALTHANSVLSPQAFPVGDSVFVTAFVATIDPDNGEFNYAGAGHPPPAIYRGANGRVDFLEVGNPPLRVVLGMQFTERSSTLLPGDKIVLYTDGLSEARRGSELFGIEGIRAILQEQGKRSPQELVGVLIEAASNWAGGNLTDDTAIIVVEREA